MQKHITFQLPIKITLFLNTAIWFSFAIIRNFVLTHNTESIYIAVIFFVLFAGNALAFLICGLLYHPQKRFTVILAIFILALNLLLTFTDQTGFFDYLTGGLDILCLVLILIQLITFKKD